MINASGLGTWIDNEGIDPSEDFMSKILSSMQTCELYLLVMTPRSAKSEYVKHELQSIDSCT